MAEDPEARRAALAADLSELLDAPVTVESWREGFDYHADLAASPEGWSRVLLSPRVELLSTTYEGEVDFGTVIHRQVRAYDAADAAGIPVPAVHLARHRDDTRSGHSLLLLDRVEDDGTWTTAAERQLGGHVRRLHAVPGSVLDPDDPPPPWARYVVDRLGQRLGAATAHVDLSTLPDLAAVVKRELAASPRALDRLLHLDVRRPNLCVVDGEVRAFIDFANAIAGDPFFELARIRYAGLLTDAFLVGYGVAEPAVWRAEHAMILAAYELDVAALLVTVAREEADDAELFAESSARVTVLLALLAD